MKLTPEQVKDFNYINLTMESLRTIKEEKKRLISNAQEDIIRIDIELRRLRIELANIKPIKPKTVRQTMTPEQRLEAKIAKMSNELEALRSRSN